MRYVRDNVDEDEDVFDEQDWQPEAQVARITYSTLEEGEIDDNVQTEPCETRKSDSSLDDYQILAVKEAESTKNRRYTIDVQAGHVKGEAMIDSGSPMSFFYFDTASEIVQMGKAYSDHPHQYHMARSTQTSMETESRRRVHSQRPFDVALGTCIWLIST